MVSVDRFFSPNHFEHCQDSFFQWVFLTDCEDARLLKKGLFLLFCGEKENIDNKDLLKKADIQVTNARCQTNVQPKNKRCDLEIYGTIGNKNHIVFLEDKTNSTFFGEQLEALQILAKEKTKVDSVAHVVYCTTAHLDPRTKNEITKYRKWLDERNDLTVNPTFVFRADIERTVNDLVDPSKTMCSDSILGQYFCFINDMHEVKEEIVNWGTTDFIGCFKEAYFASGASRHYSIEVLGLLESDETIQQDKISIIIKRRKNDENKQLKLCWETKKKSKQHHSLKLLDTTDSRAEFDSLYRHFCKKLKDSKKVNRYSEKKKTIDDWTWTERKGFDSKLAALLETLESMVSC